MARFTTSGNLITDSATGLTWVKDPSKIIKGWSGEISTNLGAWSTSMGIISARDYIQVADEVQAGSSVTTGHIYKFTDMEYGDNLWYKAKQTYSMIAYRPGVDSGWENKWTAVAFFEGTEGVTYGTTGVTAYRVSNSDYSVYHCKSGYTTGASPNDPSVDTTHWELAGTGSPSEWTNGQTWTVDDLTAIWGTSYICISGHLGDYHLPGVDTNYWEASVENWVCIDGHTAAADKYPGNATYWIAYDIWWLDTWTAVQELLYYPTVNDQIAKCVGLTYEGYSDWRMANLLELLAILDFEALDFYTAFGHPPIDPWAGTGVRFVSSTSTKSGDGSTRFGLAGFECNAGSWNTYPANTSELVIPTANNWNARGQRTLFYLVRGGTV